MSSLEQGARVDLEWHHLRFSLTMSAMLPPPRKRALGFVFFSRRLLQEIAGSFVESLAFDSGRHSRGFVSSS